MGYAIAVTGHRPKKIFGYNMEDIRYKNMKNYIKKYLLEKGCTDAITGMALGVDQIFALAVLELKEEGTDINLHCAIPCKNHPCKWPKSSQVQYYDILGKADEVVYVSEEEYRPYLMQKRNEYMVDRADEVLAVYDDRLGGGTKNCIDYAEKNKKLVTIINPERFKTSL
jgi:uncharacterized phage-like protein YoqJ